jgi:hypothetical protein
MSKLTRPTLYGFAAIRYVDQIESENAKAVDVIACKNGRILQLEAEVDRITELFFETEGITVNGELLPTKENVVAYCLDRDAACLRMREALETVLASAYPHPTEHPTMTAAWKIGRAALSLHVFPVYGRVNGTGALSVLPDEELGS